MVRRNGWNEERRQAVESLMDAYGPLVLRLMYQLTADKDAARALYIEVFLKAYRQFIRSKRLIGSKDWIVELCLRVLKEALTTPDGVLDSTRKALGHLPSSHLNEALRTWKRLDRAQRLKRLEGDEFPDEEAPLDTSMIRLKASQLLYATMAQVEAEYLHRGPVWTTYGLVGMAIIALASVTYGVYGFLKSPVQHGNAATSTSSAATNPTALPQALDSLPVTVVSQVSLTQTEWETLQLNHVVVDKNMLYLPTLVSYANMPAIQIQSAPLSSSGKELAAVTKPAGKINLILPASAKAGSSLRTPPWVVKSWNLYVTDNWAIAVVDWSTTESTADEVQQIYALYLPSGKAGLVKTLLPKSGAANDYTVTAGGGKVVIQSGYTSNGSGSAELSLSLDVYSLSGTSPAHVLDNMRQISAPFGMMVSPVVTGDTLVFQGIAGQNDMSNVVNATWYTLGWNGQLSTFVGPPLDGQPHWAVKGTQGNIWWVETTPDMTKKNFVQLLMGQLVPPGSGGQVPAQSLSESVAGVRATGQDVLWVQSTDNKLQLVVTEAN